MDWFAEALEEMFTIALPGLHGAAVDGGAEWYELLDRFLADLERRGVGGMLADLMPGMAALPNVHPLLVHFPIALLGTYLPVELVAALSGSRRLTQLASGLLYLGAVLALPTVLAGLQAAAGVPHDDAVHAVLERHARYGIAVCVGAILLSLWRLVVRERFSSTGRALHLLLSAILLGLLTLGADLGGYMVYGHGVGVRGMAQPAGHRHHHDGDDGKGAMEIPLPAAPPEGVAPSPPGSADAKDR